MSAPQVGITVTKISAVEAAAVLDRLSGSDRIEKGAVYVISVEAIRERSGPRWDKKRDDVWTYLHRKLNEHLSYQDVHHRISETDVLVAMTTEDGVAAQSVGMKVLEEVLQFFLGSVEPLDIRIKAVSAIEDGELVCVDVDPRIIVLARETATAAAYSKNISPEAHAQRTPVTFVASNGQRLQIDFALEHIVSLRNSVTAVLRVEPKVTFNATGEVIPPRRFLKLSDGDLLAIDRATLAFGALFVPREPAVQPPLIVPMSFRSMAGAKGRQMLTTIPGVAAQRVRQGAMVEFVDIDRGTPSGRLLEVVGLVGGLARGVVARLALGREALAPVQAARFNGLTADLSELGRVPDSRLAAVMREMAHQMRGKAPAIIAQGLADFRHLAQADEAGFTHAGVRSQPLAYSGREVA